MHQFKFRKMILDILLFFKLKKLHLKIIIGLYLSISLNITADCMFYNVCDINFSGLVTLNNYSCFKLPFLRSCQ